MAHRVSILAVVALLLALVAACPLAKRPIDLIMGEFEGTFTPQGGQPVKAEAKVIADENDNYRIVLLYAATDPKPTRIELAGKRNGEEVSVTSTNWKGDTVAGDWSGTITKDTLRISSAGPKGGEAQMRRARRVSPTLGQKPPAGAVVLLPYEEGKATNLDQWNEQRWICKPDGSIVVSGGDNDTKKQFGDFKLHVEFCIPFMPAARDQDRGNSGVYLHGRYEIQVLDSFGLPTDDMACGAILGQKAPALNPSLPPGQWQTYDIDFQAPRFNEIGDMTLGATITVLFNGVKVLDAVNTPGITMGAWGLPNSTGPIRLQDHGNPVQFRNIWLVEKR